MICLLCYEPRDDVISVNGDKGKKTSITFLLQKYFGSLFEIQPYDGDLCTKCWETTISFHEFYTHIESVHELINKTKEIIHTEPVKIEYDERYSKEEEFSECDNWSFQSEQDDSVPSDIDIKINTEVPIENETKKEIKKVSKSSSKKKRKKSVRGRPKKILLTCKIKMCHEEFETQDQLISHKVNAHRRIQCTYCPDLKLVVDLNKHLRNTHGISQNSMCEHCGQVYTNTRSLQDHIQRKHEITEPLQCDICKEWFKSRDTIRSHMNYVHVQGPQACSVCGKISANRKALRKHQTIHIEAWKDRFKCIICGRGFRDSTKLKEHSYIHSGVTDAYCCQFCDQSFRFGSSLSAHRMKYHPIEMSHVKERLQRRKNLEFKV